MTTGLFLQISLAVFCALLFIWLMTRLYKEAMEKPSSLMGGILLGVACCMISFSLVSYLVVRTTLFDWTLRQDAELVRTLRLYIFTALIYLLAYILSKSASELFRKRLPPKVVQTATLFVTTFFVLWSMADDVLKALGKN